MLAVWVVRQDPTWLGGGRRGGQPVVLPAGPGVQRAAACGLGVGFGPVPSGAVCQRAPLCGRVRGGVAVCAGELGADLAGVRVLQTLEDGQRLLPGLPGLGQLAGGVAGVAEVGQDVRFIEKVAGFPEKAERALVAGGGFGEVAQMVLGVPQAVPDMPLEHPVAGFRAQGECLPAERTGLLIVAEEAMTPADVVERFGLVRLVVDGLVLAQRLLSVPERVGVAALPGGQHAETLVDLGLAMAVAEPLVQHEAAGVVATSLLMVRSEEHTSELQSPC